MGKKLLTRIAVLVILLIVFVGGGILWWHDAISPVNPQDATMTVFVVSPGEGIRSIATRLKSEGLIKDSIGFFLQIKLQNLDSKIQAGDFRLSPSMDVRTITQELTHGSVDVWVTILEGWRLEEIALKLAQTHDIPEKEFMRYGQEGYMFPDTYLIPKEITASAAAEIFRDNFDVRVTPELREQIEAQGLTFAEGIVLASIVEREGKTADDRPVIAGILLNRLHEDMPLQADATLQYALGYQTQEKSWWKKTLFDTDKQIKSPFNTYRTAGLPPSPISNPGLNSITAVAKPTQTDYFYYLHDAQGGVHYAKTLDEHNTNSSKYL